MVVEAMIARRFCPTPRAAPGAAREEMKMWRATGMPKKAKKPLVSVSEELEAGYGVVSDLCVIGPEDHTFKESETKQPNVTVVKPTKVANSP